MAPLPSPTAPSSQSCLISDSQPFWEAWSVPRCRIRLSSVLGLVSLAGTRPWVGAKYAWGECGIVHISTELEEG
jgi:hypothetical protein